MKNHIILSLLIFVLFSCGKSLESPIELTLIEQDNLYVDGSEKISEGNLIIETTKAWEELIEEIDSVNNVSEYFSETDIDFDEFMIVACFDKVRSSGGYAITVSNASESKKEIVMTISRSSPEFIAPSVVTQPFYIAKFPKTKKKISFKN